MKNPLVSIVIPAYNEEKYISRCIESLLEQSYKNIEIVLVDDGSTDNTKEIIRKFPVKLLEQNHKGPGVARNLGAKESRGEILVFVDSDMEFDRNYISELIKPIIQSNAIGTGHYGERIANPENILAKFQGSPQLEYDDGVDEVFRAIRRDKFMEANGFNPEMDYSDDRSLCEKIGCFPVRISSAICYHHNAETLKEVFVQNRWRYASYLKEKGVTPKFMILIVLNILFILILAILVVLNALLSAGILILFLIVVGIAGIFRFKDLRAFLAYPPYLFMHVLAAFAGLCRHIFSKTTTGK